MEVSVSQMAKEAAIHLNVVEELSSPLSPHTVPWCLEGLLSSHLGISVVDMVLTGCFAFKGWQKIFFSLRIVKDQLTIIFLFSAFFL